MWRPITWHMIKSSRSVPKWASGWNSLANRNTEGCKTGFWHMDIVKRDLNHVRYRALMLHIPKWDCQVSQSANKLTSTAWGVRGSWISGAFGALCPVGNQTSYSLHSAWMNASGRVTYLRRKRWQRSKRPRSGEKKQQAQRERKKERRKSSLDQADT